jgi:hypothetical protein
MTAGGKEDFKQMRQIYKDREYKINILDDKMDELLTWMRTTIKAPMQMTSSSLEMRTIRLIWSSRRPGNFGSEER